MSASVRVDGEIGLTEKTVFTILDEEARSSVRGATKLLRAAVESEAPHLTGLLASSHKQSITRTRYGVRGRLKRKPEAWYGRIVERGRKPGRARTGRKVSASRANPFVDRAGRRVEAQAERTIEAGAARAAERIAAKAVK